jgi:hypothetical protein
MAFLVQVVGIYAGPCMLDNMQLCYTTYRSCFREPVIRSCLPMKQVVSTGWWSSIVGVRTALLLTYSVHVVVAHAFSPVLDLRVVFP